MFEMFQYRFAVVAVVTFTLVFNRTYSHVTSLHKRGNVDVFNLLLGLYKLNPLKGSKIYKTFSDSVMNRGEKITNSLKFDSYEKKDNVYKPAIRQLNEIEKLIHPRYKRPLHKSIEKPEFDIENVDIEKFNVDVVVNDKLANIYQKKPKKKVYDSQIENFSGIISHLNNDFNDVTEEMPSTKLIPVNDSAITRALTNTMLYPKKVHRGKKNIDDFFDGFADSTVVHIDNNIQDTPMSENIAAGNVIVL